MNWSWGEQSYHSDVLEGHSSAQIGRALFRTSSLDQEEKLAAEITRRSGSGELHIRTFGSDVPAKIVTDLSAEVRKDLGLAHQTIDLHQHLTKDKDFAGYEHFQDRFAGCGGLRLYRLVNGRPVYAAKVVFWDADNRTYVEVLDDGVSLLIVEAMIALGNDGFVSQ